jgi:hypothetical protein
MKIVTIIGARPQFIKAAVVSLAIFESNKLVTIYSSLITFLSYLSLAPGHSKRYLLEALKAIKIVE